MTVDRATLGERIMLVRRRRGWAAATLATAAGISQARLWRIEVGDAWPEPAQLVALCRALGMDDLAMLEEGEEWYARLKLVGTVAGPHVFDLPVQFDPALTIEGQLLPPPGVRDPPQRQPPEPAARLIVPAAPARAMCLECESRPRSINWPYCMHCLMMARE